MLEGEEFIVLPLLEFTRVLLLEETPAFVAPREFGLVLLTLFGVRVVVPEVPLEEVVGLTPLTPPLVVPLLLTEVGFVRVLTGAFLCTVPGLFPL